MSPRTIQSLCRTLIALALIGAGLWLIHDGHGEIVAGIALGIFLTFVINSI